MSWNNLPDHPVIRNMEMYGVPDPNEPEIHPVCPICGAEDVDEFYLHDGEIVGCSECIRCKDAYDYTADHMEE